MKKKYTYVAGFWHKNLGDDLFLKVLAQRYPEQNFVVCSNDDYEEFERNVTNKGNRLLNKILRVFSGEKLSQETFEMKKAERILFLGGSIFMEGSGVRKTVPSGVPYYVIGSNFGPFQTQDYLNYYNRFFERSEDVCFRDSYSKSFFPDLENVRWRPDVVFGYQIKKAGINTEKTAVFSLIDPREKKGISYPNYKNEVLRLTEELVKRKYRIVYMSFCEFEGDMNSIREILGELPKEIKDQIVTYSYTGNVDEAMGILQRSELIVGSRYHAVILALLLEKKILPFAYSDKLIHVMEDLNYSGPIIDLRKKIPKIDLNALLNAKPMDVSKVREEAEDQFKVLDEIFDSKG